MFYSLFFLVLVDTFWSSLILAESVEANHRLKANNSDNRENDVLQRYRLHGVLLFAVWDGLRFNPDIPGLLEAPLDEIIRKADGIFQRSEIKGSIKINLPDDVIGTKTVSIFERGSYDSFAFMEPRYFSVEFTSTKAPEKVTIQCELEEDENGIVCEGSKSYSLYVGSAASAVRNTKFDIDPNLIAMTLNQLGYEKLYRSQGDKNIKEVIETILKLYNSGIPPSILELPAEIKRMGGVFLVNIGVENVLSEEQGSGTYKKIDDFWNIRDAGEHGREDLYGQLYVLPQAKTALLSEIFPKVDLHEKLEHFEIPLIMGPAFPLFDFTRAQSHAAGYGVKQYEQFPFSLYYKNDYLHQYVVFSSMWDMDGDLAIEVDECLAKGNAFGFDTIDLKSNTAMQLSQCDYSQDISISLQQHNEVIIDDPNHTMYEISGEFKFCSFDGNGALYEPYGRFELEVDGLKQEIWNWPRSSNHEIHDYECYNQTFVKQFPTKNKVILHGKVMEKDGPLDRDDVIGNYDNKNIYVNEIETENGHKYSFYGDNSGDTYVDITLKLYPTGSLNLIQYELCGTFEFSTYDGAGGSYEPYGKFAVEIKTRGINSNYEIWKADRSVTTVYDHKVYAQPFKIRFLEKEDFITRNHKDIVLHGGVHEFDTSSSDDVIGVYEGVSFYPSQLIDFKKFPFSGDGAWVKIGLQLKIVGKTGSYVMQTMDVNPKHEEL